METLQWVLQGPHAVTKHRINTLCLFGLIHKVVYPWCGTVSWRSHTFTYHLWFQDGTYVQVYKKTFGSLSAIGKRRINIYVRISLLVFFSPLTSEKAYCSPVTPPRPISTCTVAFIWPHHTSKVHRSLCLQCLPIPDVPCLFMLKVSWRQHRSQRSKKLKGVQFTLYGSVADKSCNVHGLPSTDYQLFWLFMPTHCSCLLVWMSVIQEFFWGGSLGFKLETNHVQFVTCECLRWPLRSV